MLPKKSNSSQALFKSFLPLPCRLCRYRQGNEERQGTPQPVINVRWIKAPAK